MSDADAGADVLADKTVLLVEDDPVVASAMLFALEEGDANVAGPARRLRTAMRELDRQLPDAAILDVELLDGNVLPLAHRLQEEGVPFVFYTAHASQDHAAAYEVGVPVVRKSRTCEEAVETLKDVLKPGG